MYHAYLIWQARSQRLGEQLMPLYWPDIFGKAPGPATAEGLEERIQERVSAAVHSSFYICLCHTP